jgi:hypothetical protein
LSFDGNHGLICSFLVTDIFLKRLLSRPSSRTFSMSPAFPLFTHTDSYQPGICSKSASGATRLRADFSPLRFIGDAETNQEAHHQRDQDWGAAGT